MEHVDLAAIRACNAEFRKKQDELEAKKIAEELAKKQAEEAAKAEPEEKSEEKPAKKPGKRKYLVVDEEAPKEDEGE